MLLGTSDARLLKNLLTGKGTIRAGEDKIRAGWVTISPGFSMSPHSLTNFEIRNKKKQKRIIWNKNIIKNL